MLIKDYRFTSLSNAPARPMVWVRVVNPDTNLAIIALAIVDTGADDCAFPADVATKLGHKLESVAAKKTDTASGQTKVYAHTSRVDILETLANGMFGKKVLYTIRDAPIDFVEGCSAFLLGRKNFLSKFVLTVDGPRQRFSILKPRRKRSKR
jgi:hypothetical protein